MTIITSEPKCHVVFAPIEAWGHARPMSALAARLVQTRPLIATFFVAKDMYQKVNTEISRGFEPEDAHLRDRIRVIALPPSENGPLDIPAFLKAFADAFTRLAEEKPVSCAQTGHTTDRSCAPDALIVDMFLFPCVPILRSYSQKKFKAYCFSSCMGAAVYQYIHDWVDPLDKGTLRDQLEHGAAASGKSFAEYTRELYHGIHNRVVRLPGLPPRYDYEAYPQEPSSDAGKDGVMHVSLLEAFVQCDGIISPSPLCLEPQETIQTLTAWLSKTSRSYYGLGPLLPFTAQSSAKEKALSLDALKIDHYMEQTLRDNGPDSMIFMSFGSLFWPADPGKIWVFLDVLQEKKIPFIMSYGGKDAVIPDKIMQKVYSTNSGILTTWAPQQAILAHPVTGWFITHAGFNSMMEAVVEGVPMICWPYMAEQPLNTMHLTDNLHIAYELIEIRTGEQATKTIYRTGQAPIGTLESVRAEASDILDKAFGEDGKIKRANIMKLREQALAALGPAGSTRMDMGRLLDEIHA